MATGGPGHSNFWGIVFRGLINVTLLIPGYVFNALHVAGLVGFRYISSKFPIRFAPCGPSESSIPSGRPGCHVINAQPQPLVLAATTRGEESCLEAGFNICGLSLRLEQRRVNPSSDQAITLGTGAFEQCLSKA
jgi:hypothetical protein